MCLSLFCFSATKLYGAGNGSLNFNHFNSYNSGLSFDNINRIAQDSNGFIWIATEDGLNRYDGNSFTRYYKDELGVDSDFIVCLCADKNGNMWIGTDKGVTFYDYMQDCFIPLKEKSDKGTVANGRVTHITIDRQETVWMSVNELGLFSYRPANRELKNYFTENGHTTLPVNIRTFFIDNNDEFWFSLYFYDLWHSDSALQTIELVELKGWQPFDDIISIERNGSNNGIYVLGWQNGLCEVDLRKGTFANLIPNEKDFRPMGLVLDKEKKLWCATSGGLYMHDTITGTTTFITADTNDRFSLADENITAIFIDDSNGLWLGTFSSGLNYHTGFLENFEKYYMLDGGMLSGCFITDMEYDRNGRIWMASDKKGLLYFDLQTNELHSYNSASLPKSFFSICCDSGYIWLGSWKGVYRLNLGTGTTQRYSHLLSSYGKPDNKIHKIFKTSAEEILVGSSLGMMIYDPVANVFVNIDDFNGIYVTDIIEIANGDLWISTYANGIYRYNLHDRKIICRYGFDEKNNFHIPVDKIMSIYEDKEGRIWAGTYGAGIILFDSRENKFISFDGGNEKNIRIAFSMIEDDDGRMWVATSDGLVSFLYRQGDINHYSIQDGLLDNMIEGHSGVRTLDGNLYFSSYDGFIRFNPRRFWSNNRIPPLVITDFMIANRVVKPGRAGSPISNHINETSKITLAHNQNSFGFGLSLLGFNSPASKQLLYRLEGYDAEWNKLEGNSFHYSNVPAGEYKLHVKGVDSNGLWNDLHTPISVTVREIFFKTLLAKCIYVILFIGLIAFITWYTSHWTMKRERKKQENVRRIRESEMLHEKMIFLSNIIHEIKTPLTLIRTPLQNIMATGSFEREITEDLAVIGNNTDYLDKLVKELLDFVRIEEHGWILDYKRVDLVEKIELIYSNFKDTAKTKNLKMSFEHLLAGKRKGCWRRRVRAY